MGANLLPLPVAVAQILANEYKRTAHRARLHPNHLLPRLAPRAVPGALDALGTESRSDGESASPQKADTRRKVGSINF